MAIAAEKLLAVFEARFSGMEKALARLVAQSQKGFEDIEKAGSQAESGLERLGRGGAKGAAEMERATKGATAQTANLAAQLQDVAVQLQGGGSPFTIATQQGFQLASALGSGGAGSAVKALGAGFMAFLNPVSLASVGLIALTGYAVQYFAEMASGGEASEETLKKQASAIQSVADKWGDAIPSLRAYADELKRAADEQERLTAEKAVLDNTYKPAKSALGGTAPNAAEVRQLLADSGITVKLIADFQNAYDDLTKKMKANRATVEDVSAAQAALNAVYEVLPSPIIADFLQELEKIKPATDKAAEGAKTVRQEFNQFTITAEQAKNLASGLTDALAAVGPAGSGAILDVARAVTDNLNPALQVAVQRLGDLVEQAKLTQAVPELPFFSQPYSSGGKFTDADGNPIGVPTFDDADMQVAAKSAAATFIRQFERFIEKAAPDYTYRNGVKVNSAYRVGFGSDTVTRADGRKETVTPSTVVTLADAERDLGRRIVEFQNTIKRQIGSQTFASLNENQQGALTSIAYNYGQLPDRIVQAIMRGGGQGAVASAIAGLGSDNNGINQKRRLQEAELYGGGQFSAREAGYGAAPKKTPDQIYDLDIKKAEDQIRVLEAVVAAQGGAKAAIDQTAVAVEAARIKQQLLNEAQQAGVAITPELTAKAGQLATTLATLKAQQDANTDSQKNLNQASQEFASFGKNVMGGFIKDLVAGKSAAEALEGALGKVADRLLDMALDGIFGGGKGGGLSSVLSGIFGGARAKGGPVSSNKAYLVGEKGPELFSPGRSGSILPNNMLTAPPTAPRTSGRRRTAAFSPITNITIGPGNNVTAAEVKRMIDQGNKKTLQAARSGASGWVRDDNERVF